MNKKLIIVSIIIVLALLGGFGYWKMYRIDNTANIHEQLDNNQEDKADSSSWQTFEDKGLGVSYRYPDSKYEIKTYTDENRNIVSNRLVSRDKEKDVLTFYGHTTGDSPRRGAYFGDVNGFGHIDGEYKIFYGSKEFGYKEQEVVVLETINNAVLEIIIIDGTKFNYSGPSVGPGSDYAAVINFKGNLYNGISVLPDDDIVRYDEFLEILKSIKAI